MSANKQNQGNYEYAETKKDNVDTYVLPQLRRYQRKRKLLVTSWNLDVREREGKIAINLRKMDAILDGL